MTYPISFLMNKWLLVHKGDYGFFDTPKAVPEDIVGVAPYFTVSQFPVLSPDQRSKALTMEDSCDYKRIRARNKHLNFEKAYDLSLTYRDQYDQWLKEIAREQKNANMCIFDTSKGTLAVPLPFDVMVHAIALAQQGKIIRLHYAEGDNIPAVAVTSPALPSRKPATLKPAGRRI